MNKSDKELTGALGKYLIAFELTQGSDSKLAALIKRAKERIEALNKVPKVKMYEAGYEKGYGKGYSEAASKNRDNWC